jgi:hypothetical protein
MGFVGHAKAVLAASTSATPRIVLEKPRFDVIVAPS